MKDPRIVEIERRAYEAGLIQGRQQAAIQNDQSFRQAADDIRREFEAKLNRTAGGLRKQLGESERQMSEKIGQMSAIANSLELHRGITDVDTNVGYDLRQEGNIVRPGNIRIEDIPGRRVPYVLLVDIFIENNTTSIRESSVSISQEGPFVAVSRCIAFTSAFEFQTTDPESGQLARFAGRSFGRYRPAHSAWDLMDGQHNAITDTASWFLSQVTTAAGVGVGNPVPSASLSLPSNMSSFRTMEFDGRIEIINAGSSYPRQNKEIPSAWWSHGINSPWQLGALDFFERGEVITFKVNPTHVNNPPAGNVRSDCILPVTANGGTGWPFTEGQYDSHEGICTPEAAEIGSVDPTLLNVLSTDNVQRLPDGILTVGFEGYRIIQPIGPPL